MRPADHASGAAYTLCDKYKTVCAVLLSPALQNTSSRTMVSIPPLAVVLRRLRPELGCVRPSRHLSLTMRLRVHVARIG